MADTLADLTNPLSDFRFALMGATAANYYMPSRATGDIDFAVSESDAVMIEEILQQDYWRIQGRIVMVDWTGTAWESPAKDQVDLIYVPEPLATAILDAAASNIIDGIPVLTLPFLILTKLIAARSKDTGDVEALVFAKPQRIINDIEKVVERFGSPDDLEDFRQIDKIANWQR